MNFWRPFKVDQSELLHVELSSVPIPASAVEICSEFNKDLHVQSQRIILNIYGCK